MASMSSVLFDVVAAGYDRAMARVSEPFVPDLLTQLLRVERAGRDPTQGLRCVHDDRGEGLIDLVGDRGDQLSPWW
jgi:hypothetical protein